MDKIAMVDLELDNNPKLFTKLKEFVNVCVHNRKFSFKLDEITPENELIDNKILAIEDNKIKINNLYAFSKAFFNVYKENLDFEFSSDFLSTFKFLSEISKDFKGGGFLKVKPFLWEYSIYISNKYFNVLFTDIPTYLIQNNHDNYLFLNAYNTQLPYLKIENGALIESIINIINHINKENEAGTINLNYNSILNTLSLIAKSDSKRGNDLIKIAIEINKIDSNIISALITGLYDSKDAESTNLIENFIAKKIKLDSVFSGLAGIDSVTKSEAETFLNYFDEFYEKNELYKKPLILLLFSIINSENLENDNLLKEKVFNHLILSINDENIVFLVLNKISFIEKYKDERIRLICEVIKKDYYSNKKFLPIVAQTFWYLKDINCLEKVLLALCDRQPFSNISKKFSECLYEFDRVMLDKMLIGFIVNNKASVRFMGISFFNELSSGSYYLFQYDILNLSSLAQYKLFISITENYNEPKNTLPCLLPLLNSNSETIKESFICKLEDYSENYGGHVTDVLKEHLNDKNKNHKNALERVVTHMNTFYDKNVRIKYDINELDPYFTQSKLIELFYKTFNKKFSKMMQKATEDESSFLSAIKSIKLAKGGGWKTGNNKEVSKLQSYGHSFSMPRNHLIFPNKFDIQHGIAIHADWKDDDFKLIIDLISNEQ